MLVRGIPMVANENFDLLKSYFYKMCAAIDLTVQYSNIVVAYRFMPAAKHKDNTRSSDIAKT